MAVGPLGALPTLAITALCVINITAAGILTLAARRRTNRRPKPIADLEEVELQASPSPDSPVSIESAASSLLTPVRAVHTRGPWGSVCLNA